MTKFVPDARCPGCGRAAPVRFTGEEVERARRERQAARIVEPQCPRCKMRYWVRARDIAASVPEPAERKAKAKAKGGRRPVLAS